MDWTKAKTILIIALLVTNLFLVFTYGMNKAEETEDREELLLSVLEDRNIFLSVEIPPKPRKMPVLYIEYSGFDQEKINSLLEERTYQVKEGVVNDENLRSAADLFLRDSELQTENVVFDKIEEVDGAQVVRYKNVVDDLEVEESFIRCHFQNGSLTYVESYWLEAKDFSEKKRSVISGSEALIAFLSQKPESDAKITIDSMELVYWLDATTFDGEALVRDTALPAWKIVYNGKEEKFIYAYEQ